MRSDRKREGPDVPGVIPSRKQEELSPSVGDMPVILGAESSDWCCGLISGSLGVLHRSQIRMASNQEESVGGSMRTVVSSVLSRDLVE